MGVLNHPSSLGVLQPSLISEEDGVVNLTNPKNDFGVAKPSLNPKHGFATSKKQFGVV
jgi:hypothetical protein